MKTAVDSKHCDNQAGLTQDRLCTDHIATLCIIIKQSLEQESLFYVIFTDYEYE